MLRQLGKYEIVDKIGQGGMGEVYRAHDPVLGRPVAIKTLSASACASESVRKRFAREAQSAGNLSHPNIITIFDFSEQDGQVFMVMELLEGRDLKDLIGGAPLTWDEKLELMDQICDGLAFAHARGVIHRDLKPANIHVLPDGQAKILDFGLARPACSDMTRAGMIMGTPYYMSPEQVRGEKADARSDVFSLGAVFYELLANRQPFDADSLHAVLYKVVESEPAPLADLVPGIAASLTQLVARAMAKDPERRFQDAGEMRDALRLARAALAPETPALEASAPAPAREPDELPLPIRREPPPTWRPVARGVFGLAPTVVGRSLTAAVGVVRAWRLPPALPIAAAAGTALAAIVLLVTLASIAGSTHAAKAFEAPALQRPPLQAALVEALGPSAAAPAPIATPIEGVASEARAAIESGDSETGLRALKQLLAAAPDHADVPRLVAELETLIEVPASGRGHAKATLVRASKTPARAHEPAAASKSAAARGARPSAHAPAPASPVTAPPPIDAGGLDAGIVESAPPATDSAESTTPLADLRLGGNLTNARLIRQVQPVYPERAVREWLSAVIVLEAQVDAGGQVTDVKVVRGHRAFHAAAVEALRQWRYEPRLLNGEPTPFVTEVTMRFTPSAR